MRYSHNFLQFGQIGPKKRQTYHLLRSVFVLTRDGKETLLLFLTTQVRLPDEMILLCSVEKSGNTVNSNVCMSGRKSRGKEQTKIIKNIKFSSKITLATSSIIKKNKNSKFRASS